jgi:DNA-binding NarL/FixJ family response regulator
MGEIAFARDAGREAILLVEDDALARAAVTRLVKTVADVFSAASMSEAREAFGERSWSGLIVDVTLPDGSGLDWISEVRETSPSVPVLVLTAHCTQPFVNRAFALHASYLCKPCAPNDLIAFVRTSLASRRTERKAMNDLVDRLSRRHQLTLREADIVSAATQGIAPKEFAASRSISMNTYKSQVRSVLRKIGANSIGEVRDLLLRQLSA